MNSQNIIQLITFVSFVALLVITSRSSRLRGKGLFLLYLAASAGWSFSSFMCTSPDISDAQRLIWTKTVLPFASWTIVSYSVFIADYAGKKIKWFSVVGHSFVLLIIALAASGLIYQNYGTATGILPQDFGLWLLLISIGNGIFVATSCILLIRDYQLNSDPDRRNRALYLLAGLAIFTTSEIIWSLVFNLHSIDQVGQALNALLATYAVVRYRPTGIKKVLRKGLVLTGITAFITAGCLIVVAVWNFIWEGWSSSVGIITTLTTLVVVALMFNPLRNFLEKKTSFLLYRESFDYRQTLLNFPGKISSIIDLEKLAEAILLPLTSAVKARQASLLFKKENYYEARYARSFIEGDPFTAVTLARDGPVIKWLEREDKPLTRDIIRREYEFIEMREEEDNSLTAAQIEVLCPIKSRQKLVAVMALSKKHEHGYYAPEDLDLLMALSHQAGIALENAELYEKAKQRANMDGLTGLFNYRCFHQRLEEEIARSLRFGEIFSMILFDVDRFKKCNDLSGHLSGDEALKCIGGYMRKSVRDSDICFRYGGDEFAIILPETSPEAGQMVAERIRKSVQERTDWPGTPLTISIGVASWPVNGVSKDELIKSADAGLYYSKQTGGNRTVLACDIELNEVFTPETAVSLKRADPELLLDTVYALAATVDAKNTSTFRHSQKVSLYAIEIAEEMGFNQEDVKRVKAAALLHDIGKIGIPDRILQKNGTLSAEEKKIILSHPDLGVAIIRRVESLKDCLPGIQHHHEQFNGTGYPAGLKGSNIPLDARILAVADAFDAMTSPRSYRKTLSVAEAVDELKKGRGRQFDPEIVETFIRLSSRLSSKIQTAEVSYK